MPYGADSMENRFDDFVEEINKKIEELEARIRSLQMELDKIKTVKNITTVINQEMKGSLEQPKVFLPLAYSLKS